jgi:hypothetical protein
MPPLWLVRLKRVKWEELTDDAIRQQFADGMVKGFSQLYETEADVKTEWILFKSTLLDIAADCCGLKSIWVTQDGQQRTSWWTAEVRADVNDKQITFRAWLGNKSPLIRKRYEDAR